MPIIIDFGLATNYKSQKHYASDWKTIHNIFLDVLPSTVIPQIEKADSKILLDEIFKSSRERQVAAETLVRLFAPITV